MLPVLPLAGTLDALCRRVWGGARPTLELESASAAGAGRSCSSRVHHRGPEGQWRSPRTILEMQGQPGSRRLMDQITEGRLGALGLPRLQWDQKLRCSMVPRQEVATFLFPPYLKTWPPDVMLCNTS